MLRYHHCYHTAPVLLDDHTLALPPGVYGVPIYRRGVCIVLCGKCYLRAVQRHEARMRRRWRWRVPPIRRREPERPALDLGKFISRITIRGPSGDLLFFEDLAAGSKR